MNTDAHGYFPCGSVFFRGSFHYGRPTVTVFKVRVPSDLVAKGDQPIKPRVQAGGRNPRCDPSAFPSLKATNARGVTFGCSPSGSGVHFDLTQGYAFGFTLGFIGSSPLATRRTGRMYGICLPAPPRGEPPLIGSPLGGRTDRSPPSYGGEPFQAARSPRFLTVAFPPEIIRSW